VPPFWVKGEGGFRGERREKKEGRMNNKGEKRGRRPARLHECKKKRKKNFPGFAHSEKTTI